MYPETLFKICTKLLTESEIDRDTQMAYLTITKEIWLRIQFVNLWFQISVQIKLLTLQS